MEKSNKGLKVTIVILVLLVLGLGGYIAYDKLYAKEDKKVETKEENDNKEVVNEGELTEEILQVETEKTNFYNKYKNAEGDYGYLKSYSGYEEEIEELTDVRYSIILTADGYVKITYSEDEETTEDGIIISKKLSNIEKAIDLVELNVVGSIYEQKYYILTADGKVYLYETSNLMDKKYKATLVKDVKNVKSLKNYYYCPLKQAGCSWFVITVDNEGNYKKLAEEGI